MVPLAEDAPPPGAKILKDSQIQRVVDKIGKVITNVLDAFPDYATAEYVILYQVLVLI